jgi:hypothetical protein
MGTSARWLKPTLFSYGSAFDERAGGFHDFGGFFPGGESVHAR